MILVLPLYSMSVLRYLLLFYYLLYPKFVTSFAGRLL